jgi:hypothetical protein
MLAISAFPGVKQILVAIYEDIIEFHYGALHVFNSSDKLTIHHPTCILTVYSTAVIIFCVMEKL